MQNTKHATVMRGKLMLKKIIFVLKLSLFPIYFWPLSKDATRLKTTCVNLYHYLCIVLLICLQIPIIYSIANHLDNFIVVVELTLELSAITHTLSNFIFQKINEHRTQYVVFELVHFSDLIKPHEDIIIQRYIDKCIIFHGASVIIYYMATITVAFILPVVQNQQFPLTTEYPFNVSYQPLETIIYAHQVLMGTYVASQLNVNVLMSLLLWSVSARFEILTEELRKTTDIYDLAKCIRKHQYLLKYATKVTIAARPFALTTICCSTTCVIVLCLLLITNRSIMLLIKNTGLTLTCLSEIFMFSWAAEHLIYKSQDVAQAVFDMPWYDQSIKARKCLQFIIQRSQKPITLSVACVTPAMSLNYFASYCSTAVSFFTTFRAFLGDEN